MVAVSDGRTLAAARRRIRVAVAELLECGEDDFELADDVAVSETAKAAVSGAIAARKAVDATAKAADAAVRKAAAALTREGLSRRDAGELLGVTGQRVQQLVSR